MTPEPKESNKENVKNYYDRIVSSHSRPWSTIDRRHFKSIPEEIDDEEEEREKRLKNDEFEQDTKLKKYTLFILFGFLAFETIAVFAIAFFQGFTFLGFKIEEWSFRVLVVSTILQITAMLTIAVKHLFPNKTKR